MAFSLPSIPKRIHKTFGNLRTGVVLLILVVLASALGTFILQRPATDPDKLARPIRRRRCACSIASGSPSISCLVVSDSAGTGEPEHRFGFHRSLSQRLALLRAALSQDGFALSLGASQQGRAAHQQHRRRIERRRAGAQEIRLAGRTHRRQERTLLVFRTSSLLGHGGVHRPRQPASDLRRRHHRWASSVTAVSWRCKKGRPATSSNCAPAAPNSFPSREVLRRRPGELCRRLAQALVVEAGRRAERPGSRSRKRSWSTIRWCIRDCASTRPASERPASWTG